MEQIIIQGIGFLGVLFCLLSFQQKSNKKLYFSQLMVSVCFCIQFYLLGGISGCLNVIFVALRNILMLKIEDWKWVKRKETFVIFCLLSVIVTALSWKTWINVFPLIAVIGGNIGFWSDNAQKIRLWMLVCVSPAWIVYDCITGSIAGVINELLSIGSILISAYRFGWKAMGDEDFGKSKK